VQSSDSLGATLFDSMQSSLLAAAEIGGNRLLAYDEVALQGCLEMQDHCIAIDITDLDFQLYCHPGGWGIRLSREPPARDVDATISGRFMALVNLASLDDKVSTSIQERISFNGNVALAQKLQKLLAGLDIDWEEILAERTGDVLAFQIHQRTRSLGKWLRQSADSLLQTSSEYLREEVRLSPTEVEFKLFQSRLTELKHDVARTEIRLQQLLEKIRPS
jgi:ubiquinone biosynthesis accessory factor UbiJ